MSVSARNLLSIRIILWIQMWPENYLYARELLLLQGKTLAGAIIGIQVDNKRDIGLCSIPHIPLDVVFPLN